VLHQRVPRHPDAAADDHVCRLLPHQGRDDGHHRDRRHRLGMGRPGQAFADDVAAGTRLHHRRDLLRRADVAHRLRGDPAEHDVAHRRRVHRRGRRGDRRRGRTGVHRRRRPAHDQLGHDALLGGQLRRVADRPVGLANPAGAGACAPDHGADAGELRRRRDQQSAPAGGITMAVLEVKDLNVSYMTKKRPPFHAVKDANLTIDAGEIVGLVGESGSGKSTLGTAVLRLLDPPGTITSGQVIFDGKDITRASEDEIRPLRWAEMSTVFQSSMNALNPVVNIGKQFKDVIEAHTNMTEREIERRTAELLEMVNIDPSFSRFYAHELSGGMKQRVAIALALALQPRFVLLDEPPSGLDVVVQHAILDNATRIEQEVGSAVLMISHDLGAIMEIADRVAVMYQGQLVDDQPARDLLLRPKHPYSRVLIGSYEDLWKPASGSAAEDASVAASGQPITRAFGGQAPVDIAARHGMDADETRMLGMDD